MCLAMHALFVGDMEQNLILHSSEPRKARGSQIAFDRRV